jgi:phospholipase C
MRTTSSLIALAALSSTTLAAPAFEKRQNVTGTAQLNNKGGNWPAIKNNIKHVVYLMLENRSFDNIAGFWSVVS